MMIIESVKQLVFIVAALGVTVMSVLVSVAVWRLLQLVETTEGLVDRITNFFRRRKK